MKIIRVHGFGGPEVMQLEEIPDPVPGPGQVLVTTAAIGVNPVDTYIRAGKYGPRSFPFTPGTDAAGVIEAGGLSEEKKGEDIRPGKVLTAGQRVYVYGTIGGAYAQKVLSSVDQVHPLPDRLSFDQGAAIGVPFGTAYRALFIRGHARPGETVLVHGASGGVGNSAVQLAVNHGCKVFGTAGSTAGKDLVKKLGAAEVFDHHDSHCNQQIMDATAGRGVDLIIEMLADKNLDQDLGLLAKRGRVVIVGNRGRIEIDPRQTMAKDSDIRGMSLTHADPPELATIHAALSAGFANGTLTPIVRKHFPLAEAGKAHQAVMEAGSLGKIVIRC